MTGMPFRTVDRLRAVPALLALALPQMLASPALAQEGSDGYQMPAAELTALVDAPATPGVSLSPDETMMLISERPSLPSIAEIAAPELRIAGLRINPRTNGPSRASGSIGLAIRTLDGVERAVTGLPSDPRIRNTRWSPDGRYVAFTHDTDAGVQLWLIDVATASARRLTDLAVNDVYFGAPFDWVPGGDALVLRAVPTGRDGPPPDPMVPAGPVVQENDGEVAPARTYQDLLENQHDADLFEYFATAQLTRVSLDGSATPLGRPGLISNMSPSPDGRYLLVETTHRAFSYLVPANRFPNTIEVWDAAGAVVHLVADLPLQDNVPTSFGSVPTGVRSIGWRQDADATLYWVEAQDGGDAKTEADIRDRVYTLAAPFSGEPAEIAALALRYGGIQWSEAGFALVSENWFSTRERRTYRFDPDAPGEMDVVFDVSTEDRYGDPGSPMSRSTARGTSVLMTDGEAIYLAGQGASPEGNRPFLRKRNLATGAEEELFRSEAPYYEGPVALLGGDRLLTRRESADEPPNYFVRDLSSGQIAAVTEFPHPYPQFAGVRKEAVQYERADGVPLSATLYLPADYEAGRDGPLPAFVWAYPTEFKSADAAGQRTDSPYQFTRISASGAVPFVTRGYAVLDDASMPVIGEGEAEPNDTFREQLVANAQAAIDEGVRRGVVDPDRVGVGGHSYGAFMTGNLLAHSDLFRAGIARSGAYNRTLTPFGFQREERLFWEAPDVYFEMSPFMNAEKVNEPILLIHGEADNNSGTFPIQSTRFYSALKGLGAIARLVILPAESHGYAARESVLHMLWEMDRWLEKHVKNAPPRDKAVTTAGG